MEFFYIFHTEVEYPGFDFKKGGGLPITSWGEVPRG